VGVFALLAASTSSRTWKRYARELVAEDSGNASAFLDSAPELYSCNHPRSNSKESTESDRRANVLCPDSRVEEGVPVPLLGARALIKMLEHRL